MKAAQIGKCGELLVQYQLLLREVESAPLTTDSGIDLVAYSPRNARPVSSRSFLTVDQRQRHEPDCEDTTL